MKPLYTQEEFNSAKSIDRLKMECYHCSETFKTKKNLIKLALNNYVNKKGKSYSLSCRYCSDKCSRDSRKRGDVVNCKNCDKEFYKTKAELKKYPNSFCSKPCSTSYNNKHKTHGTRRSKLEVWLEEELELIYPNLEIHYNKKDTINSELDFYIPDLKTAIEINGIFHYEPIFGEEKLKQIQNNDHIKSQACIEHDIELISIDAPKLKYFKPENAQKYLDTITEIINNKI